MPADPIQGKAIPIASDRSIVLDVIHFARNVPSFPVECWFDLGDAGEARLACSQRISWVTLFIKAMGLASVDVPALRQFYMPYPWPWIYQEQHSVISVSINRRIQGRDRLYWGGFHGPENSMLGQIQAQLDKYYSDDPATTFRSQFRAAKLPTFLRRMGFWWRLYAAPKHRARRLGTASISTLSAQGVLNRQHPNILTATLDYGPQQPDGRIWVTLQCDHRVIDGLAAARAINTIKSVMQVEVLKELKSLRRV